MIEKPISRQVMLKKLLVFQVKLTVDAFRDILLSPVAIFCTLIDLVNRESLGGNQYFDLLMTIGKKTDRWLSLFDYASFDRPLAEQNEEPNEEPNEEQTINNTSASAPINSLFKRIDKEINAHYCSEHFSASEKATIDAYVAKISTITADYSAASMENSAVFSTDVDAGINIDTHADSDLSETSVKQSRQIKSP